MELTMHENAAAQEGLRIADAIDLWNARCVPGMTADEMAQAFMTACREAGVEVDDGTDE